MRGHETSDLDSQTRAIVYKHHVFFLFFFKTPGPFHVSVKMKIYVCGEVWIGYGCIRSTFGGQGNLQEVSFKQLTPHYI